MYKGVFSWVRLAVPADPDARCRAEDCDPVQDRRAPAGPRGRRNLIIFIFIFLKNRTFRRRILRVHARPTPGHFHAVIRARIPQSVVRISVTQRGRP